MRIKLFGTILILLLSAQTFAQQSAKDFGFMENLIKPQDYKAKRISSYDRTGGNNDRYRINKGETIVFAEINGPAVITHFWNTIMPEPFYSAKVVLRVYWDGEKEPSIEAPIGDFFCMGNGVDRRFTSYPMDAGSEGRARNSYWQMPFKKSAKFTVTNEGEIDVVSFYFQLDYREVKSLPDYTPYFHAQYRQEYPHRSQDNYLILDAAGKGHYVGCSMSVLQNDDFWWGEGDDMIFVDGEETPSLHGTGMEDAFSNAWGMYEAHHSLFYGCPYTEIDFIKGSKASFFRFNIPDPIPFNKSIKVTIENGSQNNRTDNFMSVAYWYQSEPHKVYAKTPHVSERIPYAFHINGYKEGKWEKTTDKLKEKETFADSESGKTLIANSINKTKSMFYQASGDRYFEFKMFSKLGDSLMLNNFMTEKDKAKVILFYKKDKDGGKFKVKFKDKIVAEVNTYSEKEMVVSDTIGLFVLDKGDNKFYLLPEPMSGKPGSYTYIHISNEPDRHFIPEWNIAGPFECKAIQNMDDVNPPELSHELTDTYTGVGNKEVKWIKHKTGEKGVVNFHSYYKGIEQKVAYMLTYVYSPQDYKTNILMGSDDGSKVWLNDEVVYKNPVCQFATMDKEKFEINLKKGWNKLFVKVVQFIAEWEIYIRIQDPEGILKYSHKKEL